MVPLGMQAPCRSRILTLGLSPLLHLLCMELTLCQPPYKRLRVLKARLRGKCCPNSHFTDEETEA